MGPETIVDIIFGVVMFILGIITLWQTARIAHMACSHNLRSQ
jgi:hypothetical protein